MQCALFDALMNFTKLCIKSCQKVSWVTHPYRVLYKSIAPEEHPLYWLFDFTENVEIIFMRGLEAVKKWIHSFLHYILIYYFALNVGY